MTPSASAALATGADAILVFDVGGTWFRSGVYTADDRLVATSRTPATSHRTHPDVDASQLRRLLVNHLVDEAARLRSLAAPPAPAVAAVSMGAAMNAHTGQILNSGPLWGSDSSPFDLRGVLAEQAPDIEWHVVNDITAALLCHARANRAPIDRLAVLTVSSGVGCRTFDFRLRTVPVDPEHGLQGEIGHLPVDYVFDGRRFDRRCDCGGANHLNAFSSGRGIESLIATLASAHPQDFAASMMSDTASRNPEDLGFGHFTEAILASDGFARRILDSVTLPIAKILANIFTIDPEIGRLLLTGGVVNSLGRHYLDSVLANLDRDGLYQVTKRDPRFFARRIRLAPPDDEAGLVGAALSARQSRHQRARNTWKPDTWSPAPGRPRLDRLVTANRHVSYPIVEADGVFSRANPAILRSPGTRAGHRVRRLVVLDREIDRRYGAQIADFLEWHHVDHDIITVDAAEAKSGMAIVERLLAAFETSGVPRRGEPIITVGGGSVLDATGFAASLFRRGVPYVRVPTTLLGIVDAGVGVKVGVNFAGHKNRIGTYHAPSAVFLDRSFLATLEDRQLRSGAAEMAKMAIVRDLELFTLLESAGARMIQDKFQDTGPSAAAIRRAINAMLDELEPNLWEVDLRRAVDFGHSFSPHIEMTAAPELLHGEAVALDMALCTVIAGHRKLITAAEVDRIVSMLSGLGLPTCHPALDPDDLHAGLADIAAHRGGRQRLPLPVAPGKVAFFDDIGRHEVEAAMASLREIA